MESQKEVTHQELMFLPAHENLNSGPMNNFEIGSFSEKKGKIKP